MKKISIFLIILFVSTSISTIFTNSAYASVGEEDITSKIQNILDKYDINEPFSEEDTQFLIKYSSLNNNITYNQNKGEVSILFT